MSSPTLRDTQRLFFEAMAAPRGCQDFLQRAHAATRSTFDAAFVGTEAFGAVERLDVYANSYFYRALGALTEVFPRLAKLMGDVGLHNFVTDYLLEFPSASPDLRCLGSRLPAFLSHHAAGQRTPLLVEVARVEWALSQALDAPEGELITQQQLAVVPPERWPGLRFALTPPGSLLRCYYDFEGVARLVDAGEPQQALAVESEAGHWLLVGRRGLSTYARRLQPGEGAALERLVAGDPFEAACQAAAAASPVAPANPAPSAPASGPAQMVHFLAGWLRDGLLRSLPIAPTPSRG